MDQKLKAKWVKALRSGRYRQGRLKLYRNGAYCCLGVLCKIQGAKICDGVLVMNGADVRFGDYTELAYPKFVGGLRRPTQERLADMNDGFVRGQPASDFRAIADYIEKRL